MAISTRPPRSLADIKTHSGRVSRDHQTYRDYFQVGALELERWRRNKEREVATIRVANINARIADIDKEKESLLAAAASVNAITEHGRKDTDQKKLSGLRIRY